MSTPTRTYNYTHKQTICLILLGTYRASLKYNFITKVWAFFSDLPSIKILIYKYFFSNIQMK